MKFRLSAQNPNHYSQKTSSIQLAIIFFGTRADILTAFLFQTVAITSWMYRWRVDRIGNTLTEILVFCTPSWKSGIRGKFNKESQSIDTVLQRKSRNRLRKNRNCRHGSVPVRHLWNSDATTDDSCESQIVSLDSWSYLLIGIILNWKNRSTCSAINSKIE